MACENKDKNTVDKLNDISYAFHYRSIDSTIVYANRVLELSSSYPSGKAEALNNLAFASIAKMNYDIAARQLDSVFSISDNQIELLIADVQYMRLCQRQAKNKEFYDYRERANQRIKRINEEKDALDERMQKRYLYAETEYHFVASTYFYYVGLYGQAKYELEKVSQNGLMQNDTAQYLNWLYQYGSGGMIKRKSKKQILQAEYDKLLECFLMSKKLSYRYWEANAMQSLSEHFVDPQNRDYLLKNNSISVRYLNTDNMPDTLFAGYLAQKSMDMFSDYGDIYQKAGSIRTLAQCFWQIGDYWSSILLLQHIFDNLPQVKQAPDLIASIREQMSIVYSSMNDKHNSDINRNIYLDMQERTRQDRQLDARAEQLDKTSDELNIMISSIIILIILIIILIITLLRREAKRQINSNNINKALLHNNNRNIQYINDLKEHIEEFEENNAILALNKSKNTWRNIDNRSKIFLVDSVMPLIDRMINEVDKLQHRNEDKDIRQERKDYIGELAEKIDEYNSVLTQWIQLRQGDIGLHIESFPLNDLFEILQKSKTFFEMQGIQLDIKPTTLVAKADRILTLFMINTIADNARKFTPRGGCVTVCATEGDNYVEVSISDTGCGLTEDQLSGIFNRSISNGHGFGLSNCRGILNKYHKVSKIFDVCLLFAESTVGKGSRFVFRLPKGLTRLILAFTMMTFGYGNVSASNSVYLQKARAFADSAYYSNVNASYHRTIEFADSTITCLNNYYLQNAKASKSRDILMSLYAKSEKEPAELQWFKKDFNTNYSIILDIRNEVTVAALALHYWDLYHYNNDIYTNLFKEFSADKSLGEYCRIMQRSETNKNIAVVILIILLIGLLATGYVLYYKKTIKKHSIEDFSNSIANILLGDLSSAEKLKSIIKLSQNKNTDIFNNIISDILNQLKDYSEQEILLQRKIASLEDENRKLSFESDRLYISNNILENCLSAIKHETMYYPSKILNCISNNDNSLDTKNELINQINDLLVYYKELYTILCEQLHRQSNGISIQCKPVDMSYYLSEKQITLWGDKSLYDYLFILLKRKNNGIAPSCKIKSICTPYVQLEIIMDYMAVSSNKHSNIFVPHIDNIPFLVCRQIIREISDATNLCGCGITASVKDNNKLSVVLTLPYYNNKRK